MKVKPADPAAVIRDPHTKRALPSDGSDVPDTSFWIRRLKAGDVVRIDEPSGREPVAPLTTRGAR